MAFGKRKKEEEPLVYNSFDELLEILAEERRKSLKRRKSVYIGIGAYVGLIVIVAILMSLAHGGLGGIGGMFGSIGGLTAAAFAASQTQRKAVKELANFDDVRMATRLIEALEYNDNELKRTAADLLHDLLPKLQASDAPLLTSEHHAILNRVLGGKFLLDKQYKGQLQLAILKAMQQVGDQSSLPIVQALADGKGKAKSDLAMQKAAEECLPFLRQRAEQQQQTQTLLRASDGNITPSEVLLRPAAASDTPVQADELLRAAPAEQPAALETTYAPAQQTPNQTEEQTLRVS